MRKSTVMFPRPACRICSPIWPTTPETMVTVTGSLTHVGSELVVGGQVANASPPSMTMPRGRPPTLASTELAPGVTVMTWTVVSDVPFAVRRRQLTSTGTEVMASVIRPIASGGSSTWLQPAASTAPSTSQAIPRGRRELTDFTISTL
jgi:hypothetical protein